MFDFSSFGAVSSWRKSGNNKNAPLLLVRNLGRLSDILSGCGKLSRVLYRDSQCKVLSRCRCLLSILDGLKYV